MKVLLDECVDHRLARDVVGHEVSTVGRMGWLGMQNGELLSRASAAFEVFITTDRNLAFQQNVARLDLAVVVLAARSNRLADLRLLVPELLAALRSLKPGELCRIGV